MQSKCIPRIGGNPEIRRLPPQDLQKYALCAHLHLPCSNHISPPVDEQPFSFTDNFMRTSFYFGTTPAQSGRKAARKLEKSRPLRYTYGKGLIMEYATIQVTVPKAMQEYFSDEYAQDSGDVLKRNALLLYPYVHNNVISHGRAAEILGIRKLDLIELYDDMGFPYFDMDISDVMQELNAARCSKLSNRKVFRS